MKLYEKKLQNALMLRVGGLAWARLWRVQVGVYRHLHSNEKVTVGMKGQSDLFGVMAPSGRLVCIEVKSPTGRVRKEQDAWLRMVNRFGGVGIVSQLPSDTTEENLKANIEEECQRVVALLEMRR